MAESTRPQARVTMPASRLETSGKISPALIASSAVCQSSRGLAMSRTDRMFCRNAVLVAALGVSFFATDRGFADDASNNSSIFARKNLVAWCIVPFDASHRAPADRAKMLTRLGFSKLAYDWRDPDVPTFEDEIIKCKKHGIEFFAFWGWHERIEPLIKKYQIHPQIWILAPSPNATTQDAKVEAAANSFANLVEITRRLNLKLGIYAHGDWGGEPANLVAVCEKLRSKGSCDHVGIVYNFHHGHAHIRDFPAALATMKPYLLCMNLNGMNATADPLIMPLGTGQFERQMMRDLVASGYDGPVGIIHHREQVDAEVGLRQNLDGLKNILAEFGDKAALQSFPKLN
jgi:hypothetical protein